VKVDGAIFSACCNNGFAYTWMGMPIVVGSKAGSVGTDLETGATFFVEVQAIKAFNNNSQHNLRLNKSI
jgi:hypothetical protein